MPQRVTCPTCAKVLSLPAAAAGKAGKCPGCGTRIAFPPDPPAVDELAGFDEFFQQEAAIHQATTIAPQTRACPYCAEPIAAAAKKCKHCGEFLDRSIDPGRPQLDVRQAKHSTGAKAYERVYGSLTLCRDCREPVSRGARFCPKCGCRNPAIPRWVYMAMIFGSIAVFFLVLILMIAAAR